ncbi:MAG: transcription elongation factor GreA [Firmicutes bacterium]|nr:transcription elongation factor GreA [Bacillota bacterium]
MAEILMTAEFKKQLEEKLHDLKVNGRPKAAEDIRVAREFGDLSENAEYDIAKDAQAKMEAEIADIEFKLRSAKIIEEKTKAGRVDFGSKVKIQDEQSGREFDYTIVGSSESDPKNGKISNESPLGKALMGKKKGEKVTVRGPAGSVMYLLVKIG